MDTKKINENRNQQISNPHQNSEVFTDNVLVFDEDKKLEMFRKAKSGKTEEELNKISFLFKVLTSK